MENLGKNLCSIVLQLLALAGFFINRRLGVGLQMLSVVYMIYCAMSAAKKLSGVRICEKCGMELLRQYRVCPNCGNVCEAADAEKELTEVMKNESERELEETPEELERNFARVQEMNLESALALGEDDIEGILLEKMQSDDTDV